MALLFLVGQFGCPAVAVHVIFGPAGSVSSRCLIRKSSCFSSVAHAEFKDQNASSIGFMADLMCECMPAIVLSHISLAWLCTAVLLKTFRHSFMPKKDASISSTASLKSSSSPPRFVKNDILATSLTHICIWVCPLLSFFCASSLVVALSLANRMMLLTSCGSLRVVLLVS